MEILVNNRLILYCIVHYRKQLKVQLKFNYTSLDSWPKTSTKHVVLFLKNSRIRKHHHINVKRLREFLNAFKSVAFQIPECVMRFKYIYKYIYLYTHYIYLRFMTNLLHGLLSFTSMKHLKGHRNRKTFTFQLPLRIYSTKRTQVFKGF